MALYALGDLAPDVDETAFVHPQATVIGAVTLGPGSSVWPGAVLRGDFGPISVGARTSVQDGTVVHATRGEPTVIGPGCVVGHNAHLEGCVVERDCLIGSGSVVLRRAVVGPDAMVAAGAIVTPGTVVPARALAAGVPARIREDAVTPGAFTDTVERYVDNARRYRTDLRRVD